MLNVTHQILELRQGDHLCLFYESDPAEQLHSLIPFVQEGLRHDERFVYVADDQTAEQFAALLETSGINVGRETKQGRLKVCGSQYSIVNSLHVKDLLRESLAAGFNGTRLIVETACAVGPNVDVQAVEAWEASINSALVSGTPGKVICRYNRERFSPEVLLAALHSHPMLLLGEEIYSNVFFRDPLLLSGGESGAAAKFARNISELKRARVEDRQREEPMREETEKAARELAAIVASSNDAIFSMTLEGVITSWNAGAARLYGYTADEIIGQHIIKLVPPAIHAEEPEILERTRRGELIEHYETVRQCKDGSLVDISLTVSPIKDRHGNIVGISKTARDISDKKRAEAALRRQHRELEENDIRKNEFLAMLSHELRNPLAAVQNAAELLGEETDEATKRWATGVVRRQVSILARLVDDLLEVSRITRGRIELRRDNVDICPILRRAVETAMPLIEERRHRVEILLPDDTLLVSADSARIEQLVVNLLTNSAKYCDCGGLIQLSAKRDANDIVVSVKDDGIGISPDLLSDIFELFVQDKRELDRSRGGLGIGLALARRLAELHGGTLTAASQGLGHGSEFTFRLPALKIHQSPRASASEESSLNGDTSPAPRRILVVDDNQDSAISVAKLLQRRGHQVRVVYDGFAALTTAQQFSPEVFLLDLGLPGMDGYRLASELQRSGFPKALFVAVSGYAQPRDIERSRSAGFQHHLAKPVQFEQIISVLNSMPALA